MSEATTDHGTIRRWAEAKGGKPAAVDRTHKDGDVGIIRIMFPKSPRSEHENLVEISWDEFFQEFEQRELALIYDEDGLFSKIVGRDTVERREHGENQAARPSQRGGGERSEAAQRGKQSSGTEERSLKAREYRDDEGNVHHHTNTYMQQHAAKKSAG
jgi:hypothetical protein